MLSYDYDDDNEDYFYDANEYIGTSVCCFSPEDNLIENEEVEFDNSGYEIWTGELMSVKERRKKFFAEMDFLELVQSPTDCSLLSNLSEKEISLDRIIRSNNAKLGGLPSLDVENPGNNVFQISDLDSAFIVHDRKQDGTSGVFNETGFDNLLSSQEYGMSVGLNHSVPKMFKRHKFCQANPSSCLKHKETRLLKLWRSFKHGKESSKSFKHDPSVTNLQLPKLMRRKIKKQSTRLKEVTALYAGQELKAHKGLIRTMKFSSSGRYLASGGDDCSVLIWQIREVETCYSCFFEASTKHFCDVQDMKYWDNSSCHSAPVLFPRRYFEIDEAPVQVLVGHTSDILDLSWSDSNVLLTSSKDKSVRMWKVGHDGCLKVFQHSDYVTCVQFNPIDSRYFISGSIDGKVRIWGVTNSRVADWVDVGDIITSLCHHPNGKGFVVGSVSGNCRHYDYSVGSLQLSMQLFVRGRRKSSARSITGLQLLPEDSRRTIVTSADSRIQILNGTDVVLKLKGHKKVKSHFSASLSSDGKHIVSVGDDSHVYIWNYDESSQKSSKGAQSVHFCESFISEGVSVAVPWCGINHEEEVSSDNNDNLVSSSPKKIVKPSIRLGDPNYLSRGWLFSDVPSRVSATWPEENLPSTTEFPLHAETCRNLHPHGHREYYPSVKLVSLTWNRVILTGGIDGTIRTFHYFGCPFGCK